MNKQTRRDILFRAAEMGAPDESGSVPLVFSTETQDVWRWFYGNLVEGRVKEVLLHDADAVDLSRLQAMGAALLNHDPDRIVGKVLNPRLDGKTARADVVFDADAASQDALGKVRSGSLRGVSVGYRIDSHQEVAGGTEFRGIQGPAIVATRWTPYEISLTPIPADMSAGIGRSADGGVIVLENQHTGEMEMTDEQIRALAKEAAKSAAEEAVTRAMEALKPAPATAPVMTREEIEGLHQRAAAMGGEYPAIVLRGLAEGKNALGIMGDMLAAQATRADATDKGETNPGNTGAALDGETLSRSVKAGLVR